MAFFSKSIKGDSDAKRRPGFVLTAVAATDRARLIVKDAHVRTQQIPNLFGFGDELRPILQQWKYGDFDGSDSRMEAHYDTHFELALFIRRLVFAISVA